MKSLIIAVAIATTIIVGAPIGSKQTEPIKVEDKQVYYNAQQRSLQDYLFELDDICHYYVIGESEFKQNSEKPTEEIIKGLKQELEENFNLKTLRISEKKAIHNILTKWENQNYKQVDKDHDDINSLINMYVDNVPVEHEGKTYKMK